VRYTAEHLRYAGFEARGFIFGPPLALRLNVPFVPLRKPGKLPGARGTASGGRVVCVKREITAPGHVCRGGGYIWLSQCAAGKTITAAYDLEYGSDAIEVHDDAITEGQRVVLVDDLIATGGTLAAGEYQASGQQCSQ
jgi:adenine phosphoribosyltransferase